MNSSTYHVIDLSGFQSLLQALQRRNYALIGPTIRDNTIVYEEITGVEDLPVGWGDEQEGGRYRLWKRGDKAVFGFNLGPHSWKKILFPPALKLFTVVRSKDGVVIADGGSNGAPSSQGPCPGEGGRHLAFIGVRACELHAMFVQDKVFMGSYPDPHYVSLRKETFIVAVDCSQAASTCFCTSMKTGPKADHGFDLCLTEVLNESVHCFLVEVGSDRGAEVMSELQRLEATTSEIDVALAIVENTAATMTKSMNTTNIKALLQENLDHVRWDVVAGRCLSCVNCTMVCPTCFCHTVEDTTDLSGNHAERWRKWDSCFMIEFSYIHGGSIRTSPRSRYRQWLTHKLANWIDQFGTSGCVGCGRCITWCPVGIDITEEVRALRESTTSRQAGKTISGTISQSEMNHHGVT